MQSMAAQQSCIDKRIPSIPSFSGGRHVVKNPLVHLGFVVPKGGLLEADHAISLVQINLVDSIDANIGDIRALKEGE